MKSIVILILTFLLTISLNAQDISGYGQVKFDENNFSINKVRIFLTGELVTSELMSVSYSTYGDFNSKGEISLGYAYLSGKFKFDWMPEVIVGRTLDPGTYQFPGPNTLPVIIYPKSFMNIVCANGIFLKKKLNNLWMIAGISNGSGNFSDNNKSLDFTSRITYSLPLGVTAGAIYRNGQQLEGNRTLYGVDLTWKSDKLWVNFGHNVLEFETKKSGTWLFTTYNVIEEIQLAGMVERCVENDQVTTNWAYGINIILTDQTVVRLNKFYNGWGILFQQSF